MAISSIKITAPGIPKVKRKSKCEKSAGRTSDWLEDVFHKNQIGVVSDLVHFYSLILISFHFKQREKTTKPNVNLENRRLFSKFLIKEIESIHYWIGNGIQLILNIVHIFWRKTPAQYNTSTPWPKRIAYFLLVCLPFLLLQIRFKTIKSNDTAVSIKD